MRAIVRNMLVFVVILSASCLLNGCAKSGEVAIGSEDNGRVIDARIGQLVTIRLEANLTTGYSWQVKELDERVLKPLGAWEFKPKSKAIGAASMQTLRFDCVSAGKTRMVLTYVRPWEETVKPVKVFTVTVAAK